MVRVAIGAAFCCIGVLAVAHASLRRRRWSRYSQRPLPGRRLGLIVSSTGDNPSDRDVEKDGVRMETIAGLLAIVIGVGAVIAYA